MEFCLFDAMQIDFGWRYTFYEWIFIQSPEAISSHPRRQQLVTKRRLWSNLHWQPLQLFVSQIFLMADYNWNTSRSNGFITQKVYRWNWIELEVLAANKKAQEEALKTNVSKFFNSHDSSSSWGFSTEKAPICAYFMRHGWLLACQNFDRTLKADNSCLRKSWSKTFSSPGILQRDGFKTCYASQKIGLESLWGFDESTAKEEKNNEEKAEWRNDDGPTGEKRLQETFWEVPTVRGILSLGIANEVCLKARF